MPAIIQGFAIWANSISGMAISIYFGGAVPKNGGKIDVSRYVCIIPSLLETANLTVILSYHVGTAHGTDINFSVGCPEHKTVMVPAFTRFVEQVHRKYSSSG